MSYTAPATTREEFARQQRNVALNTLEGRLRETRRHRSVLPADEFLRIVQFHVFRAALHLEDITRDYGPEPAGIDRRAFTVKRGPIR